MKVNRSWIQLLYKLGIVFLLLLILYIGMLLKPFWFPVLRLIVISLTPFFIAGFITYLFHPIVDRLYSAGINRVIAILIIYTLFFGGIGYGLYRGIPIFIEQIKDFTEHIPTFARQYQNWLSALYAETSHWPDGIQEQIDKGIERIEQKTNTFFTKVSNYLLNFADDLIMLAIIPFISFYLLKDIDKVKQTAWYLTPKNWRTRLFRFASDVNDSLGAYIRGQLFVCLLIGVAATVIFWLLKIKYSIVLGAIIGITNVIPYFGPLIGAIPALLIAATMSTKYVYLVAFIVLVLQFVEGNILSPFIVGKSLNMHPLFIIAALIIGGEIGGVIGLIVAVPIAAIIKIALLHGLTHFSRK